MSSCPGRCNPRAWGLHLAPGRGRGTPQQSEGPSKTQDGVGWDGSFRRTVSSTVQVSRRAVDFVSRFGAGQKLESIRGE